MSARMNIFLPELSSMLSHGRAHMMEGHQNEKRGKRENKKYLHTINHVRFFLLVSNPDMHSDIHTRDRVTNK